MKAPTTPERSSIAPGRMSLLSDDRLARRAVRGDQRAFEAIYRRYHQGLYRFCLAMVGNPQDAQDALQNTMVKVLRALPGEDRQIKLKPWLYRIARNESVEALRRRRDSAELEPDETHSSVETAQTAEDRERLRVLLADLEQLPDRQRSALVMRELAGLDFAQIGDAFGSSPGVARQTLYEARLSLRQMEEGREMSCDTVMRALSDADGRITRRRNVHAHLRSCASCRAFRDAIAKREGELAAIAPLPVALSAGLLQGLLGGHASAASAAGAAGGATAAGAAGAGGVAGTIGAGAGKVVATSAIVKATATVAVVAVAGISVADRSGVVDLPLPGGNDAATQDSSDSPGASAPAAGQGSNNRSDGGGDQPAKADPGQKDGKKGKAAAASKGRSGAKGKAAHGKRGGRSSAGKSSGKRSNGNPSRGKSQAAGRPGKPPSGERGQGGSGKSPNANSPGAESAAKAPPAPKATQPPKPEAAPPPPPASEPNPNAGGAASKGGGGSEPVEGSEP